MKTITGESLRGKTANGLLADWMDDLAQKLGEGDDPSLQFQVLDPASGKLCAFEFRAMDIPGYFHRRTISVSG